MTDDYILVFVLLIPYTACISGKGQGEECRQTSECVSNAECWVNVCQCNIEHYPLKGQCEQRLLPNMPCSGDMECVDGASCRANYCQCDDTHYHANTFDKRCVALSELFIRNIRSVTTTSTTAAVTWATPELPPVASTFKYHVLCNGNRRTFIKPFEILDLTDLTPGTAFNVTVSVAVDENSKIKIAPPRTATMRTPPAVPSDLRHDYDTAFLFVYWSVQGHADSFNGSLWSSSSTQRFTTPYTSYMFPRPNTTSVQILCVSARSGDLYSQMACYTFHMDTTDDIAMTTWQSSVPTWSLILAMLMACTISTTALLIGFRFRQKWCSCVSVKGGNFYDVIQFRRSRVTLDSSYDREYEGSTYVNQPVSAGVTRTERVVFENDTESDDVVECVYDQPRTVNMRGGGVA
ncbi:uncharacterized protein LOC124257983 [Haliotis rubra]|uniref:uncharacterized protein LOC124257983 n=1 Tax=Haliotis rubra TaxID=36100 RepID=UPI001EE5CE11|nr:uncharacterized protein LOC124257983 [Haliotis rubra]